VRSKPVLSPLTADVGILPRDSVDAAGVALKLILPRRKFRFFKNRECPMSVLSGHYKIEQALPHGIL
jgi:hypothetical protein